MSIQPAAPLPRSAISRPRSANPGFDVMHVREDFPILRQEVHGQPLVYLDNAATTQKPQAVLDALQHYYSNDNANIHRAVHLLSERATRAYEEARQKVRRFLNAAEPREIIFVRGATEGINLVAQSWGRPNLRAGDEIIISAMEHHSNIVPWQMLCEQTGAVLRVVPISDDGELLLDEYEKLLSDRTRLVSVVHVSNSLGTINPVQRIIELAHARGVPVLLDGAQSAPHLPIDVQELDCDFFVFSGHKIYGPTGIGVLYGKAELLEGMPPYQGGGDMIKSVTFAKTTYADLPNKFEAGTPHIAGAIGLGAALDYVQSVGLANASRPTRTPCCATPPSKMRANPRCASHRHRSAQGGRRVVRRRGAADRLAGHRHEARPGGHRRPHGSSLLPAGDGPLRHPRHDAHLVRDVQHDGGD